MASTEDRTYPNGRIVQTYSGQITRTHTVASTLFTLQPGAVPIGLRVINHGAASNAGTNARISVGSTGNSAFFLANLDVKSAGAITNGGGGQSVPSSVANLGTAVSVRTDVQAVYAEAGSASNTGGPWTILMDVLNI